MLLPNLFSHIKNVSKDIIQKLKSAIVRQFWFLKDSVLCIVHTLDQKHHSISSQISKFSLIITPYSSIALQGNLLDNKYKKIN